MQEIRRNLRLMSTISLNGGKKSKHKNSGVSNRSSLATTDNFTILIQLQKYTVPSPVL